MIAEEYPGLMNRSDEDKLQLAEELLADVMGETPEDDPALTALMESRLSAYRQHPEHVSSWSEVKTRLLKSRG